MLLRALSNFSFVFLCLDVKLTWEASVVGNVGGWGGGGGVYNFGILRNCFSQSINSTDYYKTCNACNVI